MDLTTIALSKQTKRELAKLKVHPNESFEDVVKRLLAKECQDK